MASLHYRLATPEDLAAASRLVRQVFDAQVAPLYEAEGCALFYRFIEPAVWAERDRVAPRTWLAFAGRKLVGVAHVRSGRQLSLLFVEVGRQRKLDNEAVNFGIRIQESDYLQKLILRDIVRIFINR